MRAAHCGDRAGQRRCCRRLVSSDDAQVSAAAAENERAPVRIVPELVGDVAALLAELTEQLAIGEAEQPCIRPVQVRRFTGGDVEPFRQRDAAGAQLERELVGYGGAQAVPE